MMTVDLKKLNDQEVRVHYTAVARELQDRASTQLRLAVALYVDALGAQGGFEAASDKLFRELAAEAYPGGWAELLRYTMKAAG